MAEDKLKPSPRYDKLYHDNMDKLNEEQEGGVMDKVCRHSDAKKGVPLKDCAIYQELADLKEENTNLYDACKDYRKELDTLKAEHELRGKAIKKLNEDCKHWSDKLQDLKASHQELLGLVGELYKHILIVYKPWRYATFLGNEKDLVDLLDKLKQRVEGV